MQGQHAVAVSGGSTRRQGASPCGGSVCSNPTRNFRPVNQIFEIYIVRKNLPNSCKNRMRREGRGGLFTGKGLPLALSACPGCLPANTCLGYFPIQPARLTYLDAYPGLPGQDAYPVQLFFVIHSVFHFVLDEIVLIVGKPEDPPERLDFSKYIAPLGFPGQFAYTGSLLGQPTRFSKRSVFQASPTPTCLLGCLVWLACSDACLVREKILLSISFPTSSMLGCPPDTLARSACPEACSVQTVSMVSCPVLAQKLA
ncbi:hypothetical protein Dimus_008116 [Dionaea muscipula]